MRSTLATMTLRELLAEYGINTLTEFARRAEISKSHAWNLLHGRARLGLNLAKHIAQHADIPVERLVTIEPTPPTPYRGKGGPRRQPLPGEDTTRKAEP